MKTQNMKTTHHDIEQTTTTDRYPVATLNDPKTGQVDVAIDPNGWLYLADTRTGERFAYVGTALAMLRLAHGDAVVEEHVNERDAARINDLLAQRRRSA